VTPQERPFAKFNRYLDDRRSKSGQRHAVEVGNFAALDGDDGIAGGIKVFGSGAPHGHVDLGKALVDQSDVALSQLLIEQGYTFENMDSRSSTLE
jgi:hypothetical protein